MNLRTDYKDYIPSTTNRKFNMIDNGDGTVSLVDVTVYTETGDKFGATDMNATNQKVNEIVDGTTKAGNAEKVDGYNLSVINSGDSTDLIPNNSIIVELEV